MGKTARDLVLELYKEDHITKEEANLLLDAIVQKGGTTFVPVPYKEINTTPDWTYDPYRPGQPWYTTTGTDSTPITNKTTQNG